MTKKEMFQKLATLTEVSADPELSAFVQHEIELLDKRNSKKAPTKNQKANEDIKTTILDVLTTLDSPVTVSDLLQHEPLSQYSNQKISALLRLMVEENTVVKTIEKRKSYFAVSPDYFRITVADDLVAEEGA